MNPLRRYPVLSSLLRPFRRSQQKTCAALVAALCQAATAWHDRFSVLTAAVCADTRSIPVAVSACHKRSLARSQITV
jgi:hypothetical protein